MMARHMQNHCGVWNWPVNPGVAGSNPVEPAIFSDSYKVAASVARVNLPKILPGTQ